MVFLGREAGHRNTAGGSQLTRTYRIYISVFVSPLDMFGSMPSRAPVVNRFTD